MRKLITKKDVQQFLAEEISKLPSYTEAMEMGAEGLRKLADNMEFQPLRRLLLIPGKELKLSLSETYEKDNQFEVLLYFVLDADNAEGKSYFANAKLFDKLFIEELERFLKPLGKREIQQVTLEEYLALNA